MLWGLWQFVKSTKPYECDRTLLSLFDPDTETVLNSDIPIVQQSVQRSFRHSDEIKITLTSQGNLFDYDKFISQTIGAAAKADKGKTDSFAFVAYLNMLFRASTTKEKTSEIIKKAKASAEALGYEGSIIRSYKAKNMFASPMDLGLISAHYLEWRFNAPRAINVSVLDWQKLNRDRLYIWQPVIIPDDIDVLRCLRLREDGLIHVFYWLFSGWSPSRSTISMFRANGGNFNFKSLTDCMEMMQDSAKYRSAIARLPANLNLK